MTTQQAKQAGVKAYNEGRKAAPSLNQKFIVAACGSATDTLALLEGYARGWTIANLASNSDDPTMPSVMELQQITA